MRAQERASFGHRAGAKKIPEFLSWCDAAGVQIVTLYLLSTDNLQGREASELHELFAIIADLATDLSDIHGWRVQHVGATGGLSQELVDALRSAEEATADHTGLHINLAVGYGGRTEITAAMHSIIAEHIAAGGTIDTLADKLTTDKIGEHLWTSGQADPDLVIRTSGEQRLSDFMIWQSAHSEFYVVEAFYPDLREVDFLRALRDYSTRSRRRGR